MAEEKNSKVSIRVFIISSHLMFGRGLESLLQQESELKIIGSETDRGKALQEIKELQPHVVVIYADDSQHNSDAIITDIFKVSPETKVISMSVHNNTFYVYQATRRVAQSLEDLVTAIQFTSAFSNIAFSENSWADQDWPHRKFS